MKQEHHHTMKYLAVLTVLALTAAVVLSEEQQPVGTTIGIDLGTTYSCVGVYKNGKVEIIANDLGNRIMPSYVAFSDGERLIGEAAKNQATVNPENTIFDIKRLIGRKFSDRSVQEDMKHWPFKVEQGAGDKPMIVVNFKNEVKKFHPEEISSMVLCKMREVAEAIWARMWARARVSAASAAIRASAWSPAAATAALSRRATVRKATAVTVTTASMINVMTSATPRRAD
jgi:L1 cell adhesion molecule like protein